MFHLSALMNIMDENLKRKKKFKNSLCGRQKKKKKTWAASMALLWA